MTALALPLVEEGEVVDEALTGSVGLDAAAEGGNHSQTAVLDLSLTETLGLLRGLVGEAKRVEGSSRVEALLEVGLGVTVDLGTTDEENLEEGELGDGERKVEVQVAGAIKLDLTSLVPERGWKRRH